MKKKGFTLTEILISLLILGLGIAAVFNLFPLGFQSLTYSRRLGEVSLLAHKKLEEFKTQGLPLQGQMSGREGDLTWRVSSRSLRVSEVVEVTSVVLEIEFNFQGRIHSQKFITYLP
ncbi:MAG: prepilin-type N-terminal cleavage/methylation domain-containing protein [Candidatus Omnitrophica bacterium]|nr:prepilin-type N-terminal cleavage/methylation domain-containing protein [Candidatus Omnitrophota bacterium]